MANSTLIGNISDNGAGLGTGGGFQNDYGTATLTNVTISGNQARGASDDGGGGVMVYGGTVNLINSTISGNSASSASGGGGISQLAPGKVTLTNVISAGNTSTASKPDLSGAYTSNGNNLIGSTDGSTGLTNGVNGDLAGTNAAPVNALLGLLGNHGGITQTVPLLPGSPAIDAGNDSICAASPVNSLDQRGVARPKGIHCDIGSVEMDTATFHAVSGNISAGGVGVDGVTLSYGQSTTATDSNGDYSFQVYDGWTGAVTPSKDGYVFTPISKTYATPVTTNLPGENYTATNGVTISGQVSLSGMGVEGATLTYGVGLSTLTGSDGKYLFTVPLGWSGTVTPSKAGSTFLPSEKTYISLAAHQADQDYAATLVDYTLTITSVHGAVTNNPAQVTYHYGDLVELTPVAESGWHFLEWTGDLTGSSAPGSLLISGDASVTATFSNTYTLTYAPGEHGSISGVSPQTVVQGADGSPVTAMPETGYHFVDWSDGSTSNPRTDTNVTADVSVTANFALNSYTVTFDPQGGAAVPSQTVDHGGLVSKPADQTRTGYIFGGWYDASTGGNLWDFASGTVTANTTLFARWNANTYTVTFNAQGGSTVPSQNVDYGGFATQPVDPSLADYTFGGWYDAASGGAAWDFANNAVTANQTLYAQWMLNAYTVTFDPQGGSAVSSQSVSHGSLVTEPIDPTRPGYTFAGWFNGASAWDFANDTITANTTLYAQWMLNAIPALTSFTRQTPATSPTNADTLVFRATFSEDVQNVDTGDFAISGTTAGLSVATVSASVYDITITGGDLANLNGTVGLNLTGGQNIQDLTGNALPAGEPATDETYEVNNLAPLVASTNLSVSYAGAGPSSFIVVFNENVKNASGGTGNDDASNPANYVVIEQGSVSGFQTAACNSIDAAQDARVFPSGVTYIPNTAIVNLGSALPVGSYRLFICGTTSIVDLAGNHLNNGVDTTFDFAVSASAGDSGTNDGNSSDSANTWSLPKTGFAPNMVTRLPEQPATLAYTKMSDLWLEIPSQGVKANIVGVPQSENIWDVKWLGNDAGWLNGTAFPSWEGNSVVTGHVMGADGLPGPFAKLQDLQYGEQIIVHMLDQQYIFEIRNKRLARPDSTAFAFEHLEDASYLTLVTCSGYNKESDTYSFRRIIRAVLVSVK
jgi:LPXTG-site transpeptidase (sortase) family protein